MNFTYTITPTPDRQYGVRNPDGSWTGEMAEVVKGRADFGQDILPYVNKSGPYQ